MTEPILNVDSDSNVEIGFIPSPSDTPDDQSESEDFIICRSRMTKYGPMKLFALINGFRNGRVVAEHVGTAITEKIFDVDDLLTLYASQCNSKDLDTIMCNRLKHIFTEIDKEYFSTKVDYYLATRLSQKLAAEDMTAESVEQLYETDHKIAGGAVAVMALMINQKVYVANAGNSIAVIVVQGSDASNLQAFHVSELHESHDVKETERLEKLGVNPMKISGPSRCFGDYFRKGGFRENPDIKFATAEPVVVDPAIFGGVDIDPKYCFMLLLSPSLVQAVIKIETLKKVSEYVTQLLVTYICDSDGLEGAAQAAIRAIYDDLIMKLQEKNLKPPANSMSMVLIPLNAKVIDLISPVDGADRAIKEQTINGDMIDSYVDFSEWFAETAAMQDMRENILTRIASIKSYYREKKVNSGLHAIHED